MPSQPAARRLTPWFGTLILTVLCVCLMWICLWQGLIRTSYRAPAWAFGVSDPCVTSLTEKITVIWQNGPSVESPVVTPASACKVYEEDATRVRHLALDILHNTGKVKDESVTLVTHLSANRFSVFADTVQRWRGPISASVYIRPEEVDEVARSLCHVTRQSHFVPTESDSSSLREDPIDQLLIHFLPVNGSLYPVNYMRAVSLNASVSRYVLLVDGDLHPMTDLHDRLLEHARHEDIVNKKRALIVPAFDWTTTSVEEQVALFPGNKSELDILWQQDKVQPFMYEKTKIWTGGKPTDFPKWRDTNSTFKVSYVDRFEPYIVMAREITPPYQQRFVSRFCDRASHLYEINAAGFEFHVLPNVFIVHSPHSRGDMTQITSFYIGCGEDRYAAFKKDMKLKYTSKSP